jgi:uncharacterized protein DUF1648
VRSGFVGAALLYASVVILLAANLPARVPHHFGADLTADAWTTRGTFVLGMCALGILLVGLFAGLATQVAPVAQLGAVTLLFLAVELALVYGGLTGDLRPAAAEAAAGQPVVRISRWAVAVLVGYLGYLLAWATRLAGVGRPGPRQDRTRRGTADSAV